MLRAVMALSLISTAMAITCEDARMNCAFRRGCGNALQGYVLFCQGILQEKPPDHCPDECQNALIALTSTDEGKDLMTCTCGDNFCHEQKQRIEICRPQVMRAVKSDTIVTCDTAQWICAADASCSKALEYYNQYCEDMFNGKRCSKRCKNSINILRKQERAAKLDSCRCSGKEEFDCPRIRSNMDRLCYNKTIDVTSIVDVDNNDIKNTYGEKTTNIDNNIVNDSTDAAIVAQLPYLWMLIFPMVSEYLYRCLLAVS